MIEQKWYNKDIIITYFVIKYCQNALSVHTQMLSVISNKRYVYFDKIPTKYRSKTTRKQRTPSSQSDLTSSGLFVR